MILSGAVLASLSLASATRIAAQTPPPVQGTVAPDDTTRSVYAGGRVIIAGVISGVDHALQFARNLFGGKPPAVDPLGGLREGTTVVLREPRGTVASPDVESGGDKEARVTEGVVTSIDRGRRNVTVRLDDGRKESLRLAGRQADAPRGADPGIVEGFVALSYPDDKGERIDRLFTRSR